MERICHFHQLNKSYAVNGIEQAIFQNLDLKLSLSGITVLLGKSGCGKTTLLRLMAGLEKPNSGEIFYLQQEKKYQPKIGMVGINKKLFCFLMCSVLFAEWAILT